jgi:hypothetical protein
MDTPKFDSVPIIQVILVLGTAIITRVSDVQNGVAYEIYFWEDSRLAPNKRYGPFHTMNSAMAHYNGFGDINKNVINVDFRSRKRSSPR